MKSGPPARSMPERAADPDGQNLTLWYPRHNRLRAESGHSRLVRLQARSRTAPKIRRLARLGDVSVAERLDQQGERRCGLAATRIVEMVSRKGRAPVLKHSLDTTLGEMGLRQILRHIGQAESSQRRIEHLGSAVEDELAFDAHLQFAGALFEIPGVQPAICGQTQIYAVVTDQFLRPLRF
jgi:hypothetical protein